MSRLRAVIVEDEPLARGIVRDLLDRDPEVETVARRAAAPRAWS